jgi:hypothetical protein
MKAYNPLFSREGPEVKKSIVFLLAICLLVVCPYIALAKVVPLGSSAGMSSGEAGDYAVMQADCPNLSLLAAGGGSAWLEIGLGVVLVVAVLVVAAIVLGS